MSHRSRAPRVRQHAHCDSCYSRRCRARVEVSVCCAVAPCRLLCGAVYHLCKEEDHLLLCPNVRVPCLNAEYGCPYHLARSSRAAHLQVCPASVVCCSMEWLRWPTDDTHPHSNMALQENVLKENKGQEEALDLAMALVDQSDLYARLKMKALYPELMDTEDVEEETKEEKKEEKAMGGLVNGVPNKDASEAGSQTSVSEENSVCESRSNEVFGIMRFDQEKYNRFEKMFNKEKGGCSVAEANQENPEDNTTPCEKGKSQSGRDSKEDEKQGEKDQASADKNCSTPDTSKTGQAPWHEGVLERLRQELTPQEFNMYVVHHGRMLVSFGQMEACTPRDKDFVYGSLEPIPVQTLRSFKIPAGYHYKKRRARQYDVPAGQIGQHEARCVDTSDLGVSEEDWFSDEAEATLVEYAVKEVVGHKISETKGLDGLYVDLGTQTHSFRSAPFKGKTTLSDVMVDRPLKLHLQLQTESVNSRHHRASSVFTFRCGHTFHRREFATHFRNVHSDIQMCLSGWFEQRCPLAYLGCTFSQRRFRPSTHKATVTYNQQLRSFNLRPTHILVNDLQPSKSSPDTSATERRRRSRAVGGEDTLSFLPYEVLCHMASFLDSMSLSQLALVSQLMREVCSSLLQEKGMVTLRWEKKTYSHGGAKWKAKPVWEFSHLFSSVDSWHIDDIPPISAHLKVCPYYETNTLSKPVPLLSVTEKHRSSQERSLVEHFTADTEQK
ncbi:F-box only protein 40-like [Scomber scombrus]|uniref:F-box only protein 40-like n=1 Tax=Scomber scombrus TaxID=13677 RepID=UPI002DD8E613|nr:F-box only protein 40-like [Scomber scombrus]